MLRLSRASQRESERPSLLGERASPFIGEGDGLTSKREKERECVRVLPSLVAHAIGYETIVNAHNTVRAQTHLIGFTVFVWYGKCRRLQYLKTNVGAHNTVWALTCLEGLKVPVWSYPGGTFLQACKVWSSVLRLT